MVLLDPSATVHRLPQLKHQRSSRHEGRQRGRWPRVARHAHDYPTSPKLPLFSGAIVGFAAGTCARQVLDDLSSFFTTIFSTVGVQR